VPQHEQVFAYIRAYEGRLALIVLNFTDSDLVFRLPSGEGYSRFKLVFGNYYTDGDHAGEGILNLSRGDEVSLRAYEGKVYVSDS
jgi:hypothetical protein